MCDVKKEEQEFVAKIAPWLILLFVLALLAGVVILFWKASVSAAQKAGTTVGVESAEQILNLE
ncbi:hypothetical protein QOT17_004811 [Balamuthia mandrillaris]